MIARPAHAFGPDAVAAVATRLARTLPAGAGWTSTADATLSLELGRRFETEAADPEAFAELHRFDATATTLAGAATDSRGGAVAEFTSAAEALRAAFASPDPASLVAPLARLASSGCDLADPFLTTPADADEVEGARSAFAELFDGLTTDMPATTTDVTDLTAAAIALATATAAERPLVEEAARRGDVATIAQLRARRLDAAVALASAAARQALSLANASLPFATHAPIAIWPNPAQGAVRVAFAIPAGPARIEVLDVTGRLLLAQSFSARIAGAQSIVLEAAAVNALPAGTYFVRLHAHDAELSGRLVRVGR